ncbi:MAG TPA: LytTR family DNA-binding domain-containing protein [Burkholderiales bacterium]|nr:LytTR family DNA-binding domain-containing protein [Burkholderiales bacterium]
MKVRTVIVEDEPISRARLAELLADVDWIECVGAAGDGLSAVKMIDELRPDLLFLDIEMPGISGLDVLDRISHDPAVVFTTAYDRYAVTAFELEALDYLLKPFDDARFETALKRAKERVRVRRDSRWTPDRFIIKGTGQVSFVRISQIDWIEGADYYACLHAGPESHFLRRSLSVLEQELSPAFCRIHRSTIVNLERVKTFKLNLEGEYDLVLRSGTSLRVSRRYRKRLQSALGIRGFSESQ